MLRALFIALAPLGFFPVHARMVLERPVLLDAAITSITGIGALQCGADPVAPVITLKNNGTTPITEASITYGMDGGPSYLHAWTGDLGPTQTVNIALASIPVLTGLNILRATCILPSGQVDEVPDNDSWTTHFNASSPSAVVSLILTLDDHGSDVTWTLSTDADEALYEGGPYTDGHNGALDSTGLCLTNGCYVFTINDFFGNGLCCDEGEGGYVIRDASGLVYAQSDGRYADQHVSEFCLTRVSVPETTLLAVTVQPNPSEGMFRVGVVGIGTGGGYSVVDGVGRNVLAGRIGSNGMATIDLSAEPSGIYHLILHTDGTPLVRRLVLAH
jgi:hypothetical protein